MRLRPLGLIALIALCAASATAAPPPVITIATTPIDNGAEVFYGTELGFFQRAGLDVRVAPIQGGSQITQAVASGAVDVGYSTIVPLAVAHERHIPFVVVAPAALWTSRSPNSAIIVPAGSPIRTARDLDGRTLVCSGLGTLSEYGSRDWIDQNGGDSRSVKFIELPASAMPAALASGRVDAIQVSEPYLTVAKRTQHVLAYANDAIGKQFLIGAWFTTAQWAAAHPDAVRRLAGAMNEIARWANTHHAQSAAILVKHTRIDAATAGAMVRARYAERLDAAELQAQIDVAAKYRDLTAFPAADLLYRRGE